MNWFSPHDRQHAVSGRRVKPASLRGVADVMNAIRHSFLKSRPGFHASRSPLAGGRREISQKKPGPGSCEGQKHVIVLKSRDAPAKDAPPQDPCSLLRSTRVLPLL
jgi:hypothetical protein